MARKPGQDKKDMRQPGASRPTALEGDALWQRVTETVNPLKSSKVNKKAVISAEQITEKSASPKPPRQYKTHSIQSKIDAPSQPSQNDLAHGTAAGVDKRTNQRLIRGKCLSRPGLTSTGIQRSPPTGRLRRSLKDRFLLNDDVLWLLRAKDCAWTQARSACYDRPCPGGSTAPPCGPWFWRIPMPRQKTVARVPCMSC